MTFSRITKQFNLGIGRSGHSLAWVVGGGWFRGWPSWFTHGIVMIWNRITCYIFGHDDVGRQLWICGMASEITCVNCCKVLPPTIADISAAMTTEQSCWVTDETDFDEYEEDGDKLDNSDLRALLDVARQKAEEA